MNLYPTATVTIVYFANNNQEICKTNSIMF